MMNGKYHCCFASVSEKEHPLFLLDSLYQFLTKVKKIRQTECRGLAVSDYIEYLTAGRYDAGGHVQRANGHCKGYPWVLSY